MTESRHEFDGINFAAEAIQKARMTQSASLPKADSTANWLLAGARFHEK
jgi:hypothetical protein